MPYKDKRDLYAAQKRYRARQRALARLQCEARIQLDLLSQELFKKLINGIAKDPRALDRIARIEIDWKPSIPYMCAQIFWYTGLSGFNMDVSQWIFFFEHLVENFSEENLLKEKEKFDRLKAGFFDSNPTEWVHYDEFRQSWIPELHTFYRPEKRKSEVKKE